MSVSDKMQYDSVYVLTKPMGENFSPEFRPEITPKEMMTLGVFGGKYMTDCSGEFPSDWFDDAKLCSEHYDPKLTVFGVRASQSLMAWREKGWIYERAPRGWFQWYCRYFMGRRCGDDGRQTKRWQAIRRRIVQIKKSCRVGDFACRPKQRQAVFHWAYDARKL